MNVYSSGMAKRNLVLLFILSFLVKSSLAAEFITAKNWPKFAGLEWGSSKEVVKDTLRKKGYKYLIEGKDKISNLLIFSGELIGQKVSVVARLNQYGVKNLTTVEIIFEKSGKEYDIAGIAQKLIPILKKKYGEFRNVQEDKYASAAWLESNSLAVGIVALVVYIPYSDELSVSYRSREHVIARREFEKKEKQNREKSEDDF